MRKSRNWPSGRSRKSCHRRTSRKQSRTGARTTGGSNNVEEDFGVSKQTVYLAVDFTINEGKLDAFEGIAQEMVAGTQKEPGALGYEWYVSADRKKCRLIETYTDANAV